MKKWNVIAQIMLAALCALAMTANAEVDLTPAVNYFRPFVRVTSHPVYTWNWFNAEGHSGLWTENFASDDSMGLSHARNAVALYWNSFSGQTTDYGGGNMYGPGLYLALDPAITQEFGIDKGPNWVLLQIKLPRGTRLINTMATISDHPPSKAVTDVFDKLGCEVHWSNGLDNLLSLTGDRNSGHTPASCLLGVRKIFKDILKIDGFVYPYESVSYKECGHADNHAVAIVLTSDRVLNAKGAEVLAFTNKTTDHVEDRVRIASLFLYAVQMNVDNMREKILRYNISRTGFPGHAQEEFYQLASPGGGKYTADLCPKSLDGDCEKGVEVPANLMQAFPATLSGNYPLPGYEGGGPMWPDLDGQKTTLNLSAWIQKNLFSCAQPTDYQ